MLYTKYDRPHFTLTRRPVLTTHDGPEAAGDAIDVEAHVGHMLRRAYSRAKKNGVDGLRALGGINLIQAAAVAALSARELSQAELGRRIDMEPANVHGFVLRLQAMGYVVINRDEAPPKSSRVGLTPKGQQLAAALPALAQLSAEQTLRALTCEERQTFVRLLRKVAY